MLYIGKKPDVIIKEKMYLNRTFTSFQNGKIFNKLSNFTYTKMYTYAIQKLMISKMLRKNLKIKLGKEKGNCLKIMMLLLNKRKNGRKVKVEQKLGMYIRGLPSGFPAVSGNPLWI